jgi:hypothetical protein
MAETEIKADCNTPLKEKVRDFNIAFANNDTEAIIGFVGEKIRWEMIGYKSVKSSPAMRAELESMAGPKPLRLTLRTITQEAGRCAADGTLGFDDGTSVAFCDVYLFDGETADAKITELYSYGIHIKD